MKVAMVLDRASWKRWAFFLVVSSLGMSSPASAAMRGYIVTSFDTIRLEAPVRVVVETGSGVSATGEGNRAALDRVNLSVSGGVLSISMPDSPGRNDLGGVNEDAPTLYLSTGQLNRILLIGGGQLIVRELTGMDAQIILNGNGEIAVQNVNLERLVTQIGGGGRLTLSGTTRDAQVSVSGVGALDAKGLVARNAVLANNGPGSIHLSVNGPVKIMTTGSGDTIVEGKPICSVERRGVGSVQCGN